MNTGTGWYRTLAKPPWQPPNWAFGLVWTPLYGSIAWAGGRAIRRTNGTERQAVVASLAANLALNTAWNWLFFGSRSVRGGVAGTIALDASNLDLIRRVAKADPVAGAVLVPYTLWCLFATALNADIARRN